jgi:hypothetical protein
MRHLAAGAAAVPFLNNGGAALPLLTLLPVGAVAVLSRAGCGLAAASGHGAGTHLKAYTSS